VRFVLGRAAQGAAIVLLVASLSFVLIHLAPGDPFSTALDNPAITDAMRERWRAQAGLDRPLAEQYVRYLANLARGELGPSFSTHRPVADVLRDALPNTLVLMGTSLALAFGLGIVLGVLQAARFGSRLDHAVGTLGTVLASLPPFWLASILVLLFAYWLPLFPVAGVVDATMYPYMSGGDRLLDRLEHLVLPAMTLTLLGAPEIARFQRAALLDVMPEPYLRTARAKGLSERRIIARHALRNALGPAITIFGLSFPTVLGGAVFVESVFGLPGLGLVSLNALSARDYPLVMATVMLGTTLVVAGSCVADLLAAATNPRLRAS
jgi:peptide/nickel transport system permease protein